MGIWIGGAAILHLALVHFGHAGLGCPIHQLTGVPCPGCGLTSASLLLFQGEWSHGLARHAFAPLFLVVAAALFVSAVLPRSPRLALAQSVARGEERTGAFFWILGALVIYWLARLAHG